MLCFPLAGSSGWIYSASTFFQKPNILCPQVLPSEHTLSSTGSSVQYTLVLPCFVQTLLCAQTSRHSLFDQFSSGSLHAPLHTCSLLSSSLYDQASTASALSFAAAPVNAAMLLTSPAPSADMILKPTDLKHFRNLHYPVHQLSLPRRCIRVLSRHFLPCFSSINSVICLIVIPFLPRMILTYLNVKSCIFSSLCIFILFTNPLQYSPYTLSYLFLITDKKIFRNAVLEPARARTSCSHTYAILLRYCQALLKIFFDVEFFFHDLFRRRFPTPAPIMPRFINDSVISTFSR